MVAVTHDRSLLEALAQWVVDIEFGGIRVYEGNYSDYLEKKGRLQDGERVKGAALQKQLARELEFIRSNRKGALSILLSTISYLPVEFEYSCHCVLCFSVSLSIYFFPFIGLCL